MNHIVQKEKEKNSPHKIGWGERTLYTVYALLIIVCTVFEYVLGGKVIFITSSSFVWFILLGLGSLFLKEVINKKGITSPYQGSCFLLLLRSDLIACFFSTLSSVVIFVIALALREHPVLVLGGAALVGKGVRVAAWYPSLRYVLDKEKIYQPGLIKSYVWIWCKWVWFPLLVFICIVVPFRSMF